MKNTDARIKLDRNKLLAFSQIKTTSDEDHSLKSPAMAMFGAKVGGKTPPPAPAS